MLATHFVIEEQHDAARFVPRETLHPLNAILLHRDVLNLQTRRGSQTVTETRPGRGVDPSTQR